MKSFQINQLIQESNINLELKNIATLVLNGTRITTDQCLYLYEHAELSYLGLLANYIREQKNEHYVYFNKNIHIEPTNICIHECKFCSYARKKGQDGGWEMSINEMVEKVTEIPEDAITEVHIVGGVHPERGLDFYIELLSKIKKVRPNIHIKGFTAIEIEYMAIKSRQNFEQTLSQLKQAGLDSMPGGGAEIFDETVRKEICGTKAGTQNWLAIHKAAHSCGIPTNATILYGHVESYAHRVDHMNRLRMLQDETKGFQAYIPLKYKKENNLLGLEKETTWVEDLRNFAISRIFLDNFAHIKAYWPMLGRDLAQISLDYGVNDFDGTINDTTKIYSMAGAEDQRPSMNQDEMIALIKQARRVPVERTSTYNKISVF